MTLLRIDDAHVRWAVDGEPATVEAAIAALSARPLLLLMHGYGSFEGDLIELAPRLPRDFVCASPRAPLVAPAPIENGYAWWSLPIGADGLPARAERTERFEGTGPHRAAVALEGWIDALDARVAATGAAGLGVIVPMGFSQGGCMVTSLMRLRPERFLAGVNCSGFVAPGIGEHDAALAAIRPPMFWGRDELDPVIDAERIALTRQWAPAHTTLTARLYDGILHGIGAEELADISAFLTEQLSTAQLNTEH